MANVELSRPHRSARTLALLFLAGLAALGLMLLARPDQPPPRPVEVVLAAAPVVEAPPPVVPRVDPVAQPSAERPGAEKPKAQQAEPRKIPKRSFGGCKDRH